MTDLVNGEFVVTDGNILCSILRFCAFSQNEGLFSCHVKRHNIRVLCFARTS